MIGLVRSARPATPGPKNNPRTNFAWLHLFSPLNNSRNYPIYKTALRPPGLAPLTKSPCQGDKIVDYAIDGSHCRSSRHATQPLHRLTDTFDSSALNSSFVQASGPGFRSDTWMRRRKLIPPISQKKIGAQPLKGVCARARNRKLAGSPKSLPEHCVILSGKKGKL